jgi:hypothetical protein
MNQRTTVPPLGPGPAGIGAGVTMSGVAVGAAVGAVVGPAVGAAVGAGVAEDPHAPTTIAAAASAVTRRLVLAIPVLSSDAGDCGRPST